MSTQTRRYPDALGAYVRLVTGRRTKWAVVAFGIVLAGLLGPLGGKLAPLEKNSSASFLPAGAPSTEVAAYQAAHGAPSPLPALVVFARTGGLGPSDRAAIEGAREAVGALHLPGASQPGPVRWSPTGRAATFEVPITAATPTTTVVDDVKTVRSVVGQRAAAASGRAAAASGRAAAGLEVAVGGPAGSAADASNAFAGVNGRLLAVTGAIVAVLLLLIYRSPLLWLVPLASVGLAAGWAQGAAYGLAKAGFTINGMVVGIMSVLVFGAGTDYALLLVARYREELRRRHDHHEAVAVALRRAAPAIVTSGVTVVLALLCLLVAQLSDIAALGPACAVGIVCALFAQLAFLPALLAVVGRRAFWPFVPRGTEHRSSRPAGLWARLGEGLVRHPRPVWLGLTVALAACSAGLLAYQGGVNQDNGFRTQVGSVTAQKLLSADFPGHGPAPAVVLVRPPSALGAAMRVVKATPGTGALGRPRPLGRAVTFDAQLLDPPAGAAAEHTVSLMRAGLATLPGAEILVGGETATNLDIAGAASHDRAAIIPLVVVVVALMLALLLRSLVAPLILVASVLLSYLASLGIGALVFRYLFGFAGFDPSVPIFGFVFLVALGVDYNIFLMARAREEANAGTAEGVARALGVTGSVITSAGVVLAATFAVLGVLPLVALTEVGFLVAFGVLVDTILVRSALVPAIAIDIGAAWWWPSRPAGTGHLP